VQAVDDADAAAGGASAGASVSVVRRLYDGVDRYMEDEATGKLTKRVLADSLMARRRSRLVLATH
jgi:hypothetical protein